MAKHKNLRHQFHYLIKQHERLGVSKRAQRGNEVDTQKYIYSLRTKEKMHRFASSFGDFMKAHYPKIKRFSLIKPEHFMEYFKERGAQWSERTCGEYESQARKLACMINDTYEDCHLDLSEVRFERSLPETEKVSGRDRAMEIKDYENLCAHIMNTGSRARFIPAITRSIGARLEEACSIRPENIVLEKNNCRVELRNCKNGRNRDVPIRREDLPFWQDLKNYLTEKNWPDCAGGISTASVSKAVRRSMDALGLSEKYPATSIHAIRKLYARERYEQERAGGKIKKEAWRQVQMELGHGPRFRTALFNTYIGKA